MSALPSDIRKLNKLLAENYWKTIDGKPVFRIVWGAAQTEKRVGEFHDFWGEIYLRTFRGMREVPKYPSPDQKERWILEKFIPMNNPEVWESLEGGGVYEPIWVFRGPGGSYRKPTWKAVQFLIGMLLGEKKKMTEKDIDEHEEMLLTKETAEIEEVMNNRPGFADNSAHIVVPNYIGSK
jgi:hypothetical protein